jgi:hypothetical protein
LLKFADIRLFSLTRLGAFRRFRVHVRLVPVGAFAFRVGTVTRLNLRIAGNPLMAASLANKERYLPGLFRHAAKCTPKRDIPSKNILVTYIPIRYTRSCWRIRDMDVREQKGLEIATSGKLEKAGDGRWFVRSQAGGSAANGTGYYTVNPHQG